MRVVNQKSVGADADVASDPASRASPLLQIQPGQFSLWEPGLPAMQTQPGRFSLWESGLPAMPITGCCVRSRIAGKPAPTESTRSILLVGVWLASDADYGVLRLTPHRGQARSCRLNPVDSPCGGLACQRCRSPGAASDPASRASPLLQTQPGQFSLWESGLPAMRITGCCVRPRIAGKPAPADSTRSILPVGVWLASDADYGVLRPTPHRGQARSYRINPVNSP